MTFTKYKNDKDIRANKKKTYTQLKYACTNNTEMNRGGMKKIKYLNDKNAIISHKELPKSELVHEILQKRIKLNSEEFKNKLEKMSDDALLSYLDKFTHKYKEESDENVKEIFEIILYEFHIRLVNKFKTMTRQKFAKYIHALQEYELSYHWAFLSDVLNDSITNKNIIEIKKVLSKEVSNRYFNLKEDHKNIISLYSESKIKFKKHILKFDKDEITYNLASISTHDINDNIRDEIMRALMLALKNLETKNWLKMGFNIQDIAQNINMSEYIVELLERSIKMPQKDFLESLQNIDDRTFLILYQYIFSGEFHNHWHHNTLRFANYYKSELNRREENKMEEVNMKHSVLIDKFINENKTEYINYIKNLNINELSTFLRFLKDQKRMYNNISEKQKLILIEDLHKEELHRITQKSISSIENKKEELRKKSMKGGISRHREYKLPQENKVIINPLDLNPIFIDEKNSYINFGETNYNTADITPSQFDDKTHIVIARKLNEEKKKADKTRKFKKKSKLVTTTINNKDKTHKKEIEDIIEDKKKFRNYINSIASKDLSDPNNTEKQNWNQKLKGSLSKT